MREKFFLPFLLFVSHAKGQSLSLHFPKATPLAQVAKHMAAGLEKNLILNSKIKGELQILCPQPLEAEQAFEVFLSALERAGYTALQLGNTLHILALEKGISAQEPFFHKPAKELHSQGRLTQLLSPKHLSAPELHSLLLPLSSPKTVNLTPHGQQLLLHGSGHEVQRLLDLINYLDQPNPQDTLECLPIKHLSPEDLKQKLQALGLKELHIFPNPKGTELLLKGDKNRREYWKKILKNLDVPPFQKDPAQKRTLHVHPLNFSKATDLAKHLSQKETKKTPSSKFCKVLADPATNSLILQGSYQAYEELLPTLRQLDKPKEQLLIQLQLMQVGSSQEIANKISMLNMLPPSQEKKGAKNSILAALGSVQNRGFLQAEEPSTENPPPQELFKEGLEFAILGEKFFLNNWGPLTSALFLEFLQVDENTKTLAKPCLLTNSDTKAHLKIGESIYYPRKIADHGLSWDKEDGYLSLELQGRASAHDRVLLELKIELRDRTGERKGRPIMGKKSFQQKVELKNGETSLIGGLLHDFQRGQDRNKLPLLGQVPGLGFLGEKLRKEHGGTRLLIFVQPHIVYGPQDIAAIQEKKMYERTQARKALFGMTLNKK